MRFRTCFPSQTVGAALGWAWRSPRLFATALLAVALVLGAHYRFHRLDRWDMNGSEGSTWAAVVAPNVCEVVGTFWQVEHGGKYPIYDLVLHEWVRVFGANLFAMRAMSAALGTIAIGLLFFAVREIYCALGGAACSGAGETAGAFAGLIYALNVTLVISDRTAREFPLLVVAELLQIIFLMRAQRRGVFDDYLGLAIFTALMLPINYSASFLLLSEAFWLGCLLAAKWAGSTRVRRLKIFGPGLAVLAGLAMLTPLIPDAYRSSRDAMAWVGGKLLKPQPISWPFTVLRDAFQPSMLFWFLTVLIVCGGWRQWRKSRLVAGFLAVWTLGPVLAAFAETYLMRPIEMPRYVIIAFVGMFAFAGFGAARVRSTPIRLLLAVMIVVMSAPTVHRLLKVSLNGDWRKATALAFARISPGEQIAVFPPFDLQAAQFYLPPERRAAAVAMDSNADETRCGTASVSIFRVDTRATAPQLAAVEACFPQVIAKLNLLEVRTR